MKQLFFICLLFLLSCKKDETSTENGSFTMKTNSGKTHSSTKFSRSINSSVGTVYFNADPNNTYRKFYYFSCDFDTKNDIALDITLNGSNIITQNDSQVLSSVTIEGKWIKPDRSVVRLTSNEYPGRITGTYSFYSNQSGLICSGNFDYTVK